MNPTPSPHTTTPHPAPGDPQPRRAQPLIVAAAVCNSLEAPTHLLACARAYPPEHAGKYELPGGKVETGETPEAALTRELREELTLDVQLGAEIPAPNGDAWPILHGLHMRVWLAQPHPHSQPHQGRAHNAVHWVELDALHQLPWLEADRPIINAITATLHT